MLMRPQPHPCLLPTPQPSRVVLGNLLHFLSLGGAEREHRYVLVSLLSLWNGSEVPCAVPALLPRYPEILGFVVEWFSQLNFL